MRSHPSRTPIDYWPLSWCVMECCEILHDEDRFECDPDDFYLTMSDEQRRAKGWPVTLTEMREFIKKETTN